MLYAFLLDADPGSCRCEVHGGEVPRPEARHHRRSSAPTARLQSAHQLSPAGGRARVPRSSTTTIDLPLAGVLARMEQTGIRVDPAQLRRSPSGSRPRCALTAEIHRLARHAVQHQLAAAARARCCSKI